MLSKYGRIITPAQRDMPLDVDAQIQRMTSAKHHKANTILVVNVVMSYKAYIAALCNDAHMWAPGSVGR